MPVYEYHCYECDSRKEYLQKLNDLPIAVCPVCGSENYHKLVSAAGFQLKGSGWYATDFKGSSASSVVKESQSDSGPKSDGEATSAAPSRSHSCNGEACGSCS